MKCPFCGYESREQVCEKCKALIPVQEPKKQRESDSREVRKKDKE